MFTMFLVASFVGCGPSEDEDEQIAPPCVATTCDQLGASCGVAGDGCGGNLDCGTCALPASCGGGGTANQCGVGACEPETEPQTAARQCPALSLDCGNVQTTDNCGNSVIIPCGTCTGSETCAGAGTANVCGEGATCVPETEDEFCARLGKTCGSVQAADNCGIVSIARCGGCTFPEECSSNVCEDPNAPLVWRSFANPSTQNHFGVWGSSASSIFSAAQDGIFSFNGVAWTKVNNINLIYTFRAVDGSGSDNIWAVGAAGIARRWNGTAWSASTTNVTKDLNALHVTSATEAWAVGETGTIIKWNGTAWSVEASTTTESLYGVWAAPTGEVWAVGTNGTLLARSPAGTWSQRTSGVDVNLFGIHGTSDDNLWIVGDAGTVLHNDNGIVFKEVPTDTTAGLRDVFQSTWGVVAVGVGGTILRGDAFLMETETSPTTKALTGVWSDGSETFWAVGVDGTILRYD